MATNSITLICICKLTIGETLKTRPPKVSQYPVNSRPRSYVTEINLREDPTPVMLETYLNVKIFEKETKLSSYPQFIVGLCAPNSLRLINDLISFCYQQTINLLLMLHYIIRKK